MNEKSAAMKLAAAKVVGALLAIMVGCFVGLLGAVLLITLLWGYLRPA
jgi:hypothetical protein